MTDARAITLMLGGRWYGRFGAAPCPVCQPDRRKGQNALTLADGNDGRLLAHCKRLGCSFEDILAAAGIGAHEYCAPDPAEVARREAERLAEALLRAERARRTWRETRLLPGTIGEDYLLSRGITCDLPAVLRFHPACWHGATATRWPAMIAMVEGGEGFAVHRTYLRPDGSGKAPIDPAKAMLGAVAGGAVRLTSGPGRLVVAEGTETALSLASGLIDGPATIWAALSTSGMRSLRLPTDPGHLTIAPDGDAPGLAAAHALAERAAALGWTVGLLSPPANGDFNDLLTGKAVAA